jgi:hypothetical protein
MPAPIAFAPLAWTALRVGAVAAVALYAARGASQPKDIRREQVLDDLPDGGRFRRTLRLGRGRGFEIDAAALGRVRLRRV